jgi:two-component system sensor histidine kinase KdpD
MARQRERRTAALYAMTKEQAIAGTKAEVVAASAKHVKEVFDSEVAICLSDSEDKLVVMSNVDSLFAMDSHELGVAQWVLTNGQMAGVGTSTLPGARAIYLPLRSPTKAIGVIGVLSSDKSKFLHPEELHLLEIFVGQIALAIERATVTEQLQKPNQLQTHPPKSLSAVEDTAQPFNHIG